ncbi:class I SAM-dependent methyltransferase [Thiohalorhabdus methylotrophus]|uniref:Class I SAM-dependent methyltransferase n=1 Tax=Thiohalorhabdus methylotrophus TaxID=3242694 RepID=A0ABV4TRL1_9GAMM
MNPLQSQFALPRGPLGRVAGWVMALSNRALARETLSLLEPARGECVLEIGAGPGVGIGDAAERVKDGLVMGVDLSEVMLAQAARRNRAHMRAGRVGLQRASASRLPFRSGAFQAAFTINNIQLWPDPMASLDETARILCPGGRLAIALQQRDAESAMETAFQRRSLDRRARAAGLEIAAKRTKPLNPTPAFLLLVRKPSG